MDEARAIIDRLERIEALDREGATAAALLAEVRELLREAEAWVETERGDTVRAAAAIERCRVAYEAGVMPVA
jgi:NAD-specific glutamate dehydrogenase